MALFKTILPFVVALQLVFPVLPVQALTLEECVQLALKKNPDLQKQQLSLDLAHEDVAEQRAGSFGKLDIIGSYTHYNLPRTLAPLTPASIAFGAADVATTQDLFGTAVVYEVPLFTGFAQTRAVEAADLQREMAGATLKLSREQLIYNVKTLYVQILSLQDQEEAQVSYVNGITESTVSSFRIPTIRRLPWLSSSPEVQPRPLPPTLVYRWKRSSIPWIIYAGFTQRPLTRSVSSEPSSSTQKILIWLPVMSPTP